MEAEDIKFGLPARNVHVARAGIIALAAGGIMPFQHEHQPFRRWAKCPSYWILAFFGPSDQTVPMDLSYPMREI